jgi:serine/threonine protein kinase
MDDLKDGTVKLDSGSLQSQAGCPERYEIKSVIGTGGMGIVFQAVDVELGRDVAIKVLLFEGARDEEAQERFLREAKVLAVLNHPNIVRIFSSGLNEKGNPYHVMEFLKGKSLSADLADKRVDATQFFSIFLQVLHGMEEAHKSGIVHRDLKPSNIMHCKDADGQDLYKIIDFGIARIQEEGAAAATTGGHTLTRTDAILGSPLYMSPQQCRGERGDERSDIYAIGCIMYECIAGEPPFKGESAFETMYMHMSAAPPSLEQKTHTLQSKKLAALIERCLQKDPEQRPASISDLRAEIEEIQHGDLTKLDIFLTKSQKKKNKTKSIAKVAAWGLGIVCSFALVGAFTSHVKKQNVENILKRDSKQEKHVKELAKAKERMARWNNPKSIKGASAKEAYLFDLFALGRAQLDSAIPEEVTAATKTYDTARQFAESSGADLSKKVPACYAMMAKAEAAQNDFEKSAASFERAINTASKLEESRPPLIDIYLERSRMHLKHKDVTKAFQDFIKGTSLYRKDLESHAPSDISYKFTVVDQVLDPSGPNRCQIVKLISHDLMRIQPGSQNQRAEMLVFANELCHRISACKVLSQSDTMQAANYSRTLFNGITKKGDLPSDVISDTNFLVGKYASRQGRAGPTQRKIQIESLIEDRK